MKTYDYIITGAGPAARAPALHEALPGAAVASESDLFEFACRVAKTDHRPVGRCKMGKDPMAVVSPELKVQGLEGL